MNAFETMRETAVGWLRGREAQEIARKTGVRWLPEEGRFRFTSLGEEMTLSFPECRFEPEPEAWQELILLHCFARADGTPLLGKDLPLREMAGGMARGAAFDRKCELTLARLGLLPESELLRRCERLGGVRIEGKADLCVRFELLPCCPMTLKLWYAEEDIPASGRLLADASADHVLSVEDAVMLGELILQNLSEAAEKR